VGRSLQGFSAIRVTIILAVTVIAGLSVLPLLGQAQDTINNSKNALPEGALDSGSDGDSEEDGEPGVTGPEDGDSETGQDGAFTGVQFNNPPEAVAAGSTETFEATANADQPLEGATFYVTSDGGPSGSEVSASCDDGTECTVERQLPFPESGEGDGYSANVEVQFSTGSGSLGGRAQTTTQVVSVELNQLSDEFSANAKAADNVLTAARLQWTTGTDPTTVKSKTCQTTQAEGVPTPESDCAIPFTPLDLPSDLNADEVDVIAEFDTEEGQVAATTTTNVDSGTVLEVRITNIDGDAVSGAVVSPVNQDSQASTDQNGKATLTGVAGDVDLDIECGSSKTKERDVDTSQTGPVEIDIVTTETSCQ
jgi:hypothetical protein